MRSKGVWGFYTVFVCGVCYKLFGGFATEILHAALSRRLCFIEFQTVFVWMLKPVKKKSLLHRFHDAAGFRVSA